MSTPPRPDLLPAAVARSFRVVPLERDNGRLKVLADRHDEPVLRALSTYSGSEIEVTETSADELTTQLERTYRDPAAAARPRWSADPIHHLPADPSRRSHAREHATAAGLAYAGPDPASPERLEGSVDLDSTYRLGPQACRAYGAVPVWIGDQRVIAARPGAEGATRGLAALAGIEAPPAIAAADDIADAVDSIFGPGRAQTATAAATAAPGPGAAAAPSPGGAAIGAVLAARGLATAEEIEQASKEAERLGEPLETVLAHRGTVDVAELSRARAEAERITFADPAGFYVDDDVVRLLAEERARELRAVPIARAGETVFVAVAQPPDAGVRERLEQQLHGSVRWLLAPAGSIDSLLERAYESVHSHEAVNFLRESRPEASAERVLSGRQKLVLGLLTLLVVGGLVIATVPTLVAINVLAIIVYVWVIGYRLRLTSHSLGHDMELPVSEAELAALDERELPIYTILVPLYKEPQMLAGIVRAVAELDYPATRLDVKILLEEDDTETLEALAGVTLPPHFRLVVVPDALPKTKPKACNYGLLQARGKHVVIFDAEDAPEPDQLKKAVAAFAKAGPEIACLQAKLNYFNQHQNLITRWFTTEYSQWFDLLLPGLAANDSPIPLGGTSNHFLTERLLEVGAWDPFNVTEDADLGVRLHRGGYRTAVIDSTTYEEANSEVFNWIRQRSRWIKGYIQTWLVQMRHPIKLWRELGTRSFFSFQLIVGGTPAILLLNPIYWTLTTVWLLTEAEVIQSSFPGPLFYLGGITFYVGNFRLAYMAALGAGRRGYHDLIKYALLIPVYWVLMSIGAWRGLLQLITRPSYWEKTEHGLHLGEGGDPIVAVSAGRAGGPGR